MKYSSLLHHRSSKVLPTLDNPQLLHRIIIVLPITALREDHLDIFIPTIQYKYALTLGRLALIFVSDASLQYKFLASLRLAMRIH